MTIRIHLVWSLTSVTCRGSDFLQGWVWWSHDPKKISKCFMSLW